MFYYYVAYPIVAIFGLAILITIVVLIVKGCNRHRRVIHAASISIREEEPQEINNVPSESANLPSNNIHMLGCVFGDSNQPHWKLNCGALVCNRCIVNFSSAMQGNEIVYCPCCNSPVYHFEYMNRILNSRAVVQPAPMNPEVSIAELNTSQICNICYERLNEMKIECRNFPSHMVCKVCYDKLINVQRILLCPFCRTLIRNNISEEQAPVVLDMH